MIVSVLGVVFGMHTEYLFKNDDLQNYYFYDAYFFFLMGTFDMYTFVYQKKILLKQVNRFPLVVRRPLSIISF